MTLSEKLQKISENQASLLIETWSNSTKSAVILWQIQSEELTTRQMVDFVLIWMQVCLEILACPSECLEHKMSENTYLICAQTCADSSNWFTELWQSGSITDCGHRYSHTRIHTSSSLLCVPINIVITPFFFCCLVWVVRSSVKALFTLLLTQNWSALFYREDKLISSTLKRFQLENSTNILQMSLFTLKNTFN